MYLYKHYLALAIYLYAALSAANASLAASPQSIPDGWFVGLKCSNPLSSGPDGVREADVRQIDVSACAVTLNCLISERHGATLSDTTPMLNVTVTVPSSGYKRDGTRDCHEVLEELLFTGRDYGHGQWIRILAGQDRRHPGKYLSHQKRQTFQSDEDEDESESEDNQPAASSEEHEKYRGIFDYLISTIQRRTIQKAATSVKQGKRSLQNRMALESVHDSSSRFSSNLKRMLFKKRPFSYYLNQCMESFCEGYDLEKACGFDARTQHKLKPVNICEVCHPKRDDFSVRQHCEKRVDREIKAFYGVCGLLVITTGIAMLLFLFRRMGRRLAMPYRFLWTIRRRRFTKNAAATFSSNSISAVVPGLFSDTSMGTVRRKEKPNSTTNDMNGSMSFTAFQRKLNQYGMGSKGQRKRIQDVFDIESLEPKSEKVFVLPRATNANIRTSSSDASDRRRGEAHGSDDSVEMGTVRRTSFREQDDVV